MKGFRQSKQKGAPWANDSANRAATYRSATFDFAEVRHPASLTLERVVLPSHKVALALALRWCMPSSSEDVGGGRDWWDASVDLPSSIRLLFFLRGGFGGCADASGLACRRRATFAIRATDLSVTKIICPNIPHESIIKEIQSAAFMIEALWMTRTGIWADRARRMISEWVVALLHSHVKQRG